MMLKVTLRRSGVSRPERQRDTLRGLGLSRISQTRLLNDTAAIRGMLAKGNHLVEWEQVEDQK